MDDASGCAAFVAAEGVVIKRTCYGLGQELPLRSLSVTRSFRGSSIISMPNFFRSCSCAASKTFLNGALCFPKTVGDLSNFTSLIN